MEEELAVELELELLEFARRLGLKTVHSFGE
jgi:hypothetical protein